LEQSEEHKEIAACKTIRVEGALTKIAIYSSWAKNGQKSAFIFADTILINPKFVGTILGRRTVEKEKCLY